MNSQNIPPKLLVIARSGRMLAQMAVDAGFLPFVIDCFCDEDTRQLAKEAVKVASLELADLRPVLKAMRTEHGLQYVVYGSGFEPCASSLDFLEHDWVVLGNSASVFKQIQDKCAFFEQLTALSIGYPETVFSAPGDKGSWLLKPMRGEGGVGVRRYLKGVTLGGGEHCWQKFVEGDVLSVLFVASKQRVEVLGFNQQWTASIDDEQPFLFGGVANRAEVSIEHQLLLREWLVKLVAVYPLRGLGSLDFIVSDGRCYLLEINARVPASAQLYGKRVFMRHVQACLDEWGDVDVECCEPAAYQVIYAKQSVMIPDSRSWPDWVVDRPNSGAIIGKGQPICSIIARGNSPIQVDECLRQRQEIIENCLNTGC